MLDSFFFSVSCWAKKPIAVPVAMVFGRYDVGVAVVVYDLIMK